MEPLIRSSCRAAFRFEIQPCRFIAVLFAFCVTATAAQARMSEYRIEFAPSQSSATAGYTLHVGTESQNYLLEFDLGSPPVVGDKIVYSLDFEDSVDLFVALQAYDSNGDNSPFSNEMLVVAQPRTPPPPSDEEPPTDDPPSDEPEPEPLPPVEEDPDLPIFGAEATLGLAALRDGQILGVDGLLETHVLTIDSLAADLDLRPSRCDLDGDGDDDLVMGFGPGSDGQVAVLHLQDRRVVFARSISTATATYRSNPSAVTNPACGDVDGDGLGEVIVGFGSEFGGRIQLFDDESTGFAPMSHRSLEAGGYLKLLRRKEKPQAMYPAMGDIDGDGRDELVVGSGGGGEFGVAILDDASGGFKRHPATSVRRGTYKPVPPNSTKGSSDWTRRPALGDLDGDGLAEIAVSFDEDSGGQILLLDDARVGYPADRNAGGRYLTVGRADYRRIDGETHAAIGEVDGDEVAELVVGFRRSGRHELQILDRVLDRGAAADRSDGFVSVDGLDAPLFPSPMR